MGVPTVMRWVSIVEILTKSWFFVISLTWLSKTPGKKWGVDMTGSKCAWLWMLVYLVDLGAIVTTLFLFRKAHNRSGNNRTNRIKLIAFIYLGMFILVVSNNPTDTWAKIVFGLIDAAQAALYLLVGFKVL